METKLRLYSKAVVRRQTFKGCKILTVPNQSMSLAEILERYTRKESLPLAKEGVYETRFGDLEKIAKQDPVEQLEYAQQLRQQIKDGEQAARDRQEAAKKAEDAKFQQAVKTYVANSQPEGGVRNGVASRDTGDGAAADRS